MSTLPADALLADAGGTLTNANAKTALEQLRDCAAESPGGAAVSTLTIATGSVTPTGWLHAIDTQGGDATDDLANIVTTNHPAGREIVIYAANAAHTVVVKHNAGGAGAIHTQDAADITLDEVDIYVRLVRIVNDWYEIGRAYGSNADDFRAFLGLGTAAVCDTGTGVGNVVVMGAGPALPALDGSALTGLKERGDYFLAIDAKATTTDGGAFTSGAWRTRTLAESVDESTIGSVASSQITLTTAGYYYLRATAPAYEVNRHQVRFYETTGAITSGSMASGIIYGSNALAGSGDATQTASTVVGKFQLTAGNITAGANVFELQHRCETTNATNGFGISNSFGGSEIYSVVELWRSDI